MNLSKPTLLLSPNKRMKKMYMSGNYNDCLRFIETLDPESVQIQTKILRAGCWANLGEKLDEAVKEFNDVILVEPDNSFAYYGLGLSLYVSGKLDECITPFSRAVELNKESIMNRALLYKNYAIKVLNLLHVATVEYISGNLCSAFEKLTTAAAVDPANNSIKKIVQDMRDKFLKVVVENLEKEVLDNIKTETKMNHVEFLINSNKLEDAAKMLPDDEQSARYYYLKGRISYLLGGLKSSIKDFTKALAIDGTMKQAEDLLNKATMFVELIDGAAELAALQKYSSACHNLTNALDVDVENKRVIQAIYFQRASCNFNMNKQEAAFIDYMQFEALQNETGMILNGIKF